jgi:hypothetical protein
MQFALGASLMLSTYSSAAALRGMVTNGTAGGPSAGDEVVLLSSSQDGMMEAARTKSTNAGTFHFLVPDADQSYLVRVIHQGVAYHQTITPGVQSLEIRVYDVAERLEGISAIMDVQRFEANDETLRVRQLVTMRNASRPPRTLAGDRTFSIQLPPAATLESGLVQVEMAQPLRQKPLPGDREGDYYFQFPLRPGDTRFAVIYTIPYSGEALIAPTLRNPQEQFVVMIPKSMEFRPVTEGVFRPMADVTADNVLQTEPVNAGQILEFRISGTGVLAELQSPEQRERSKEIGRPGGGLGPPSTAPDPLLAYRWWILGAFAMMLVGGGFYVTRQPKIAPPRREPLSVGRSRSDRQAEHEYTRGKNRYKPARRLARRCRPRVK